MKRPTKTQAQDIALLLIMIAALAWTFHKDGLVGVIGLVLAVILAVLVIRGALWAASKVGRDD